MCYESSEKCDCPSGFTGSQCEVAGNDVLFSLNMVTQKHFLNNILMKNLI